MSRNLGLDLGTNSIGWALLDTENNQVIDAGVRIFQEGVDRDTKGAEVSKNETRRNARGARRNRKRRNYRKDKLFRMLVRMNLLPSDEKELDKVLETDPYFLRAKGLDEKLEPYEYGRVLYHLCQRRGFWSNRKTSKGKEDGIVIKSGTELQCRIDDSNSRTLGEYFNKVDKSTERVRGCYTFRSMYESEFDQLWDKQSSYYPDILTEENKKAIDKAIFYQRPLKPTDELIGKCDLEPEERNCPRADWHARRFRILQTVNNLKIYNADGTEQEITAEQREHILSELFTKKEVSFDSLRKHKKMNMIESQTFNLEENSNNKKLKGDEFYHKLKGKKLLGPKLIKDLSDADILEINDAIVHPDLSDEEVIEKLMDEYGITEEQATGVINVTLPKKYSNFSRLAIQKLLPYLEKGYLTHEAIKEAYGSYQAKKESKKVDFLEGPEDLRNPIVNKALWEVRKVVNAIIREYGKPDRIYVEMTRDLKGSKKQRDEIRLRQWKNEQENKNAENELKAMGIHNPSYDDRLKFKLWEECGKVCPYTGKPISQHQLFGAHPEVQIEHILPYSRSLDDSFMNKTLCFVNENIDKGKETPYEFYCEQKPQKWEEILQRIKILPFPKRRKFWQKEVVIDSFISRQLNDTGYISKKVVEYLKTLGVIVQGRKGQVTAELRHQWGLNSILDFIGNGMKNRDDHRHHAIDAAVVAVTTNEHLRSLAHSKYNREGVEFNPPWEGFREYLKAVIDRVNVSHRVTRKVSGQLHEETNYGPTGLKDQKGQDIYVYRKKLCDLTLNMVDGIVDPIVKELVQARLAEYGITSESKGSISKDVWKEPLYMKSKNGQGPEIKKVRIRDVANNMIVFNDRKGKPYRAVAPGSNHHIEIFEYNDTKGNIKRDGRVITMYEAVRRSQKGKPVICRDYDDNKKFVCSLSMNEMFNIEQDDYKILCRVQKISSNTQIFFRPHTFGGEIGKHKPISKVPNKLEGYKVTIDPIGRLCRAND